MDQGHHRRTRLPQTSHGHLRTRGIKLALKCSVYLKHFVRDNFVASFGIMFMVSAKLLNRSGNSKIKIETFLNVQLIFCDPQPRGYAPPVPGQA
jgi:hypothetical protein